MTCIKKVHDICFIKLRTRQAYTVKILWFVKILGENNYSFCKKLIVDVWQVPEYIADLQYFSAPNIPGFWICQSSEYTSDSEYVRILDIPWFLNVLELHRVLNIPECAWVIPGYTWLFMNVPKSVWMAFVFRLPIVIPCLKEP